MSRFLSLLAALALMPCLSHAQEAVLARDDGPPISITSPDTGSTFVYGTLKGRQLYWSKSQKMLIARVTFTDASMLDNNSPQDDSMEFRLPGVAYDEGRGVFSATTAKGEVIPVAHIKKALFIKTIEVLPNARVRIIHEHGTVNVILEAISPNDPAMHPAPVNPDGTYTTSFDKLLNN
ncbi:MAG TPA: hypothetical protein VHY09_07455 [Candidatus Methylacidiphilales bacterium]|nr:hypothetical protein [Candidatus Methylacidiphilales bacterium]